MKVNSLTIPFLTYAVYITALFFAFLLSFVKCRKILTATAKDISQIAVEINRCVNKREQT